MNTFDGLLEVIEAIDGLSESNSHFIEGLVRRIDESGKDLESFTIAELVPLIEQHRGFFNSSLSGKVASTNQQKTSLKNRINYLSLDADLLLQRVKQGGHSGQFLANAFISSYRTKTPFGHSLGEIIRLDNEAIKLFHQILHIRFIKGWSDDEYYQIEQEVLSVGGIA